MLKDIPCIRDRNCYRWKYWNYELLPHIRLRYYHPDVNYDDVMHGWTGELYHEHRQER